MERSTSTVDKNSLKADLTQEFTHLSPIPIKDLKVFIFMKPNAEDLDPYMIHVISFLQKYEIACYVTEEACASLKQDKEARSKAEVNNASIPEYDLDKLTIFSDSNQREINRIITLGGDGTVVQAIKLFYKDKCPLMITFGQESIGYLCCFESENYEAVLFYSLINIAEDYDPSLVDRKINEEEEEKYGDPYVETRERVVLKVGFDNEEMSVKSSFNPQKKKKVKFGTLYALNEITVDRGGFNYLTNIECYINGYFLTVIQGDGVIISSPTGSTAYNMSAGGSIVYNYVNSLLLTPICPHSLSFRPLILPDTCCITLKASKNSRCDYYTVSLDGDSRFEIKRGEKIDIEGCMCTLPFVTFNPKDPMETWCERLNSSLHWNSRPIQKEFKNK